jgi:hypothetical protein
MNKKRALLSTVVLFLLGLSLALPLFETVSIWNESDETVHFMGFTLIWAIFCANKYL